jgi:hypothetical protein
MTLQSSGTIRWSDIRDEFGANISGGGVSLGRYRNSDSNFSNKNVGTLTNLPLDVDVPRNGTISASSFYSKRLNMVLDMYGGGTETRVNCRTRYNDSSKVKVVGGYRSRPSNTSNTRVIVNVNKTFGSETGATNRVAVRSGSWGSDCDLEFEIGSNGKIYGAGGNGGDGGSANGSGGSSGSAGSSALGIEYSCVINNLGRIQSGYGGGGGGGGRREYRRSGKKSGRWVGSSGGGGGGGAGLPNSSGGDSPSDAYGGGSNGSDGGNGSNNNSGNGGGGGNSAAAGGDGATVNNSSTSGSSGGNAGGSGGSGGANGWALRTTQGSLPTITGNAVIGRTATSASIS